MHSARSPPGGEDQPGLGAHERAGGGHAGFVGEEVPETEAGEVGLELERIGVEGVHRPGGDPIGDRGAQLRE